MASELALQGGNTGGSVRTRTGRRARLRRAGPTALLLAPMLLLLGVLFVWPLARVLLRSLDAEGEPSFSFDFANYSEVLQNELFLQILKNTAIIALEATVVTVLLAYPTAYVLSRLSRRWATVLLLLVMVPFLSSILLRLYAFTQILGREGPVNEALGAIGGGGPYDLLFNRTAAVIGMVHYLLPYLILILYGSMAGIDRTLVSAANSLGASAWQAFRKVFFPLTFPALVAGTLLVFVLGLGFFLTPAVLGGPGDKTVAVYIQQEVDILNWGVASAMGILLLVLTMALFMVVMRTLGTSGIVAGSATGQRGAAPEIKRGFSLAGLGLNLFVAGVFAFLLLPLLIVFPVSITPGDFVEFPPTGFSLRWYEEFVTDPFWTTATTKSLFTAVAVGLLSVLIALGCAVGIKRVSSAWGRTALQALIFAPIVVPAILTAIAIFDVQARIQLLGTTLGLVLAHAVLALPYSFVVVQSALAATDQSLEEAAWTLGASKLRGFVKVTLRIIVPSLVGAFALAFVTSWDEVVVALFQTGINKTLPVVIFASLSSGAPPTVAAIGALIFIAVVVFTVVPMVLQERRLRRARRQAAENA